MTRRLIVAFLLLALPVAAAPEPWWESYERGVAAVNAKNYKLGAELLQKAIAARPGEGTNVRAGRSLITYVPHFWLGIAKFNLGDPDGALREWRTSEEQGVVARTDYYARMKDWVARAQNEKQRTAQHAASAPKKAADDAISRALQMQLDALSAGGDRSDDYLAAQRKLQDARTRFQKAGTDVGAYKAAEEIARQAAALFAAASEEGKKARAARAAVPPPARTPAPQVARRVATPVATPVIAPSQTKEPAPAIAAPAVVEPPPVQVITEAEVERRIAEQEAKRRAIAAPEPATPERSISAPAEASTTIEVRDVANELRDAYRAYAAGDLARSERLLTRVVATHPAAEAYLLRGCTRYTRAMLSAGGEGSLRAVEADFQSALAKNRALRLDPRAFSPKLIAFFENVRSRR